MVFFLMYGAEPVGLCAVVPCGSATAPVFVEASRSVFGAVDEMPTEPIPVIRSLSELSVSTVNVSAAGNLIAVLVSPVCMILSAIDTSLLAVIIPTESMLVTS